MLVNESQLTETSLDFVNFDDNENGSSGGNMATPTIECLRYLEEAHSTSLNVTECHCTFMPMTP